MNTAPTGWTRRTRLLVAVAATLSACLGATPSPAQTPLATVVVYEVTETLTLKGKANKRGTTPQEFQKRLADASLLAKKPLTATPGTPFASTDFLVARASSSVDLRTGLGPVHGQFNLLTDLDPTRDSLDTLLIITTGKIEGTLDLSTAMVGYASLTGTWKVNKQLNGTLAGVFLIAFQVEGMDGHWYLNMGPGSCAEDSIVLGAICSVTADETLLGTPLTKAVFEFYQ